MAPGACTEGTPNIRLGRSAFYRCVSGGSSLLGWDLVRRLGNLAIGFVPQATYIYNRATRWKTDDKKVTRCLFSWVTSRGPTQGGLPAPSDYYIICTNDRM